MGKLLKKEELNGFLENIKKSFELFAPVKTDTLRFEKIENVNDICLEGYPLFSIKKLFLKPKETVFEFENNKIRKPEKNIKPIVIFGVRKCDLNAVNVLDKLFSTDPSFSERKKKTILIGLHCNTPPYPDYCFCESMELGDFHDVYFYDLGDKYYIEVGSEKGKELVKKLPDYDYKIEQIKCSKKLKNKKIDNLYDRKEWEKNVNDCLSCAQCNTLCPTCLCYDIIDNTDFTFKKGERTLQWDECHFKDFTKVAGGHIFRETRSARFKHRIYHKIDYFKKEFGIFMCTGCGRCIRGCPKRIDWVETINKMKK